MSSLLISSVDGTQQEPVFILQIFSCDLSSNPVDARSNEIAGRFLESRVAFFSEITLGTKVQPLKEY